MRPKAGTGSDRRAAALGARAGPCPDPGRTRLPDRDRARIPAGLGSRSGTVPGSRQDSAPGAGPCPDPGRTRLPERDRARIPGRAGAAAAAPSSGVAGPGRERSVSARGRPAPEPGTGNRRDPGPVPIPVPMPLGPARQGRGGTARDPPAGPEAPDPAPAVGSGTRSGSASSRHRSGSGTESRLGFAQCPLLSQPRSGPAPPATPESHSPPAGAEPARPGPHPGHRDTGRARSVPGTPRHRQRAGLRAVPAGSSPRAGARPALSEGPERWPRDSGTGSGAKNGRDTGRDRHKCEGRAQSAGTSAAGICRGSRAVPPLPRREDQGRTGTGIGTGIGIGIGTGTPQGALWRTRRAVQARRPRVALGRRCRGRGQRGAGPAQPRWSPAHLRPCPAHTCAGLAPRTRSVVPRRARAPWPRPSHLCWSRPSHLCRPRPSLAPPPAPPSRGHAGAPRLHRSPCPPEGALRGPGTGPDPDPDPPDGAEAAPPGSPGRSQQRSAPHSVPAPHTCVGLAPCPARSWHRSRYRCPGAIARDPRSALGEPRPGGCSRRGPLGARCAAGVGVSRVRTGPCRYRGVPGADRVLPVSECPGLSPGPAWAGTRLIQSGCWSKQPALGRGLQVLPGVPGGAASPPSGGSKRYRDWDRYQARFPADEGSRCRSGRFPDRTQGAL
ncbi:collagen alpha-1(I) chain-like [Catharus ustulatus]|uniref:collagen alpha-1(I) chain-like n=1 Tax=Catharus ustulatus TaxID=91951 RepID=UPI001407E85B|nr:collagen alpha-1(I) chain-like [Catharus ustulatus]